jgi:hypothetical protein
MEGGFRFGAQLRRTDGRLARGLQIGWLGEEVHGAGGGVAGKESRGVAVSLN